MADSKKLVQSPDIRPPRRPILEVSGLHKAFNQDAVLRGVSLELYQGQALVLIGPSGSGKTTLLRCINALVSFELGRIELDGEDVLNAQDGRLTAMIPLPRLRQSIGLVFQEWNLWPNMTVRQNVAMGPRVVLRMTNKQANLLVESCCNTVGLSDKLDSYASELSGGQKQRAAIARALAMNPKVLLLDEVTASLDPPLVAEVLEVISTLKHQSRALVIATHHIEFAKAVGDEVAFLWNGRIHETGPAALTLGKPRTSELMEFLQLLKKTW